LRHSILPAAMAALLVAAIAVASAEETPARPDRVESFTLRDQFNDEHRVVFPRKQPTVLVLADRRGSQQLEGWLEPLGARYEGRVHIDGVADVRGVPRPLRWGVRQIFRRGSEKPIMLDWEDTLCTALDYEKNEANLLVLDHDGRIIHRAHGEASEDALDTIYNALDKVKGTDYETF